MRIAQFSIAAALTLTLVPGRGLAQNQKDAGALTPAEQKAAIHAVREYALSYTKRLPNYTCSQTTKQTLTRPPGRLLRSTVIEEQLSFVDNKEIRRVTRIDGHPVSAQAGGQPEAMSWGEFGNLLDVIFEPATHADLRWDRVATLNRRRVNV